MGVEQYRFNFISNDEAYRRLVREERKIRLMTLERRKWRRECPLKEQLRVYQVYTRILRALLERQHGQGAWAL